MEQSKHDKNHPIDMTEFVNIEEKQIKGLNARNLWWFGGGIVVCVMTVMSAYFGLKSSIYDLGSTLTKQIELMQKDQSSDKALITIQLQNLQKDNDNLKEQGQEDRKRIEELEKQQLYK